MKKIEDAMKYLSCPKCGGPTYPKVKTYAGGGIIITHKCTDEDCPGKIVEDVKK